MIGKGSKVSYHVIAIPELDNDWLFHCPISGPLHDKTVLYYSTFNIGIQTDIMLGSDDRKTAT